MGDTKKIANFAIIILLLVAMFFGYKKFFGGDDTVAPSSDATATAVQSEAGRELLTMLAQLKSLTLDGSIFSNPAFRALQDFNITLEPQPKGRINPFAPVSAEEIARSREASARATFQVENGETENTDFGDFGGDLGETGGNESDGDGSSILPPPPAPAPKL